MSKPLRDRTQHYTKLQWWLAAGLLVFCVAFYLFVYRPASQRGDRLVAQIHTQQAELADARTRAKDLPKIASENDELAMRLARSKRVPKQTEWAEFVRDLTRLSNQASLRKFSYKYGTAKRIGDFAQFPVMLDFEGDAMDAYVFLKQVEDLPRLTRLRSLSLKTRPEKAGQIQAQLDLNTYFSVDQ